jgi:hypothetical protein
MQKRKALTQKTKGKHRRGKHSYLSCRTPLGVITHFTARGIIVIV